MSDPEEPYRKATKGEPNDKGSVRPTMLVASSVFAVAPGIDGYLALTATALEPAVPVPMLPPLEKNCRLTI